MLNSAIRLSVRSPIIANRQIGQFLMCGSLLLGSMMHNGTLGAICTLTHVKARRKAAYSPPKWDAKYEVMICASSGVATAPRPTMLATRAGHSAFWRLIDATRSRS